MPWLLQAAPQADGSWWAMGALQPGGGALQLEWEEPLSAQHKTIRRSLHSEHSVRRHKTQNFTDESALIEVKAFTLQELPLFIVPLCPCAMYPCALVPNLHFGSGPRAEGTD